MGADRAHVQLPDIQALHAHTAGCDVIEPDKLVEWNKCTQKCVIIVVSINFIRGGQGGLDNISDVKYRPPEIKCSQSKCGSRKAKAPNLLQSFYTWKIKKVQHELVWQSVSKIYEINETKIKTFFKQTIRFPNFDMKNLAFQTTAEPKPPFFLAETGDAKGGFSDIKYVKYRYRCFLMFLSILTTAFYIHQKTIVRSG